MRVVQQSRPVPSFQIGLRPDRSSIVVEPQGELDLATVPQVESEVAELRARGFAAVVLDLRGLTFIDSTGLRLLLRLDAAAESGGWSFAVVADDDGPAGHLLELTGLTARFSACGRGA